MSYVHPAVSLDLFDNLEYIVFVSPGSSISLIFSVSHEEENKSNITDLGCSFEATQLKKKNIRSSTCISALSFGGWCVTARLRWSAHEAGFPKRVNAKAPCKTPLSTMFQRWKVDVHHWTVQWIYRIYTIFWRLKNWKRRQEQSSDSPTTQAPMTQKRIQNPICRDSMPSSLPENHKGKHGFE